MIKKLSAIESPYDTKEMVILKLDGLFTNCKKQRKPMFGPLWTEIEIKLLILYNKLGWIGIIFVRVERKWQGIAAIFYNKLLIKKIGYS